MREIFSFGALGALDVSVRTSDDGVVNYGGVIWSGFAKYGFEGTPIYRSWCAYDISKGIAGVEGLFTVGTTYYCIGNRNSGYRNIHLSGFPNTTISNFVILL